MGPLLKPGVFLGFINIRGLAQTENENAKMIFIMPKVPFQLFQSKINTSETDFTPTSDWGLDRLIHLRW